MIISGALSTIAGITFIASSRMDDAHLGNLAGYAALGAVLYLLSARRNGGRFSATPPAERTAY